MTGLLKEYWPNLRRDYLSNSSSPCGLSRSGIHSRAFKRQPVQLIDDGFQGHTVVTRLAVALRTLAPGKQACRDRTLHATCRCAGK